MAMPSSDTLTNRAALESSPHLRAWNSQPGFESRSPPALARDGRVSSSRGTAQRAWRFTPAQTGRPWA